MSVTKVNADVFDLTDAYAFSGAVTGAGKIVQVVSEQTGAAATGTTVMPRDDSIPQNDEGIEVMTLAITPTNSSNKLLIEVLTFTGFNSDNNSCVALFQDSTRWFSNNGWNTLQFYHNHRNSSVGKKRWQHN